MMKYDYYSAIYDDVKDYIEENYSADNIPDDVSLYDELWVADSVTGNGSGSYTFNRAKAREYVEPNMALAVEALRNFGYELNVLGEKLDDEEWEWLDVAIRCYLLGGAISGVLNNYQ